MKRPHLFRTTRAVLLAFLALHLSCGPTDRLGRNPPVASPSANPPPKASSNAAVDPLGPPPTPPLPNPFDPPVPGVRGGPEGSKLWLLERHALPLVSIAVVVPYGSAAEPPEKAGLAHAAADMLDEGAGSRDAIAYSQALNDLGAKLSTYADRDATFITLEVLASHLEEALPLLADAVLRPRFDKKDWTRVKSLWMNALKARADDPEDVARVVTAIAYYGADHPYGHPQDGTLTSAKKLELADVVRWHRAVFRPADATFVVAGDVAEEDIIRLLHKAFAGWTKNLEGPALRPLGRSLPPAKPMRTVLVEREDAPQIIMSLARSGPPASDPSFAFLSMLNVALGGSFTSRLNQNLREDHGWTYGARSRFNAQRGAGLFVVRAAIRADAIGPALLETAKEIDKLAKEGLDTNELGKLKALMNGEALQTYGTLHGALGSLASNAALGLPPHEDARQLALQRSATEAILAELARRYLDISSATIVLVGPKEAAMKAFADNKLPTPDLLDSEGKALQAKH